MCGIQSVHHTLILTETPWKLGVDNVLPISRSNLKSVADRINATTVA